MVEKTTAVRDLGFLLCELCDEVVEECYDCGQLFRENDTIYCENEGEIHLCEDCAKDHLTSRNSLSSKAKSLFNAVFFSFITIFCVTFYTS